MLVEDEKTVLTVSKEMLEALGYTVHTAGNGQEAIAAYLEKRNTVDLVISGYGHARNIGFRDI